MSEFIVNGQALCAPDNLQVLNFRSGGMYHFDNQKRDGGVTEVVVHETVTSSAKATVSVLQQRKLGVHFILGGDGTIYQHGDLATDFLWHASEHNRRSVGIEVVNPYYPKFNPRNSVWTDTIAAPWADGRVYVVPARAQAEALFQLLAWLTSADSGLTIPANFVGLSEKSLAMARTPVSQLGPGIYAHHYFGHMDGAWLVLYAWLRMQPQLDPDAAYKAAKAGATDVRKAVDLSAYFDQNPYLST